MRWAPAVGPVRGYYVYVARNGGRTALEASVVSPEVTLNGVPGELLTVWVSAFGSNISGPVSPPSEPIRFVSDFVPSGFTVLDCASCKRIEFRRMVGNNTLIALPHPGGGNWDLQRFANFTGQPGTHALFRERTTGALWVGNVTSTALIPIATHITSNFATSAPGAILDLDGDGAAEIVQRNLASGTVEIWSIVNGAFTRKKTHSTPAAWRMIGAHDLDLDGEPDLWFDTREGEIRVMRLVDLSSPNTTRIAMPRTDLVPWDIADYDGDAMPDVLWRELDGDLHLALLRGSRSAPTIAMSSLISDTDDRGLMPRTSLQMDDKPGLEVVLQDVSSGTIQVMLPGEGGRKQPIATTGGIWRLVQAAR